MYRQGDVMLIKIDAIPKDAKKIKIEHNKIIFAYGETTGHMHAIVSDKIDCYQKGTELYLEVFADNVFLNHGIESNHGVIEKMTMDKTPGTDHDYITIPKGIYKFDKQYQREYSPERIRGVED